ncbi:MAG: hypothetical protein HON70_12545 [Lentisphaerae bacterium]|nr:hypothetical protein [Lentisphaerota bacterium]
MKRVFLYASVLFGCVNVFAAPSPAVAFVSRQFTYLEEYGACRDLREAGFEVGVLGWREVSVKGLQPFNVVVLTDIPPADERGKLQPWADQACQGIHTYIRNGGGCLAAMGAGGWDKGRVAANVFLEPLAAQLLDEQVTDSENLHRQTRGIRWYYSWTTNLTPHPATEGINALFYPARPWRADGQKTLYAPQLGDGWQVLVRGATSARSSRTGKHGVLQEVPGTYPSAPPIVAARTFGKGRAAIFALWPNWTFWGARHPSMGGVVWETGARGIASDTGAFCLNLLKWLAEPSAQGTTIGGYSTPEAPPTRPEQYPGQPVDWDEKVFREAPPRRHFRVLAGARTAYSGGVGTVKEYCAAARSAGYQAVLFSERLDQLTAPDWDRLREECQNASDRDFLALPGIDYETMQGDEYVAFGEFDFPKAPGLAAGGKRIDDTYNFWGSQMHHGFIAITRLHAHPDRDPQMLKNMTACAVYTYRNGDVIDDSLDHYLALDAQFHNLVPFVLHLVDSPGQVAKAATTGLQNVWRVADALDLRESITPHDQAGKLYWFNPHRAYLSAGPKLDYWDCINKMYWGSPTEGHDQFLARFSVSSPEGVREVKVLDRGQTHLRFANDAGVCQREFPGHHDNQHVFHLLATDAAGKRLLSPGIRIRFSPTYVNQCGDHQNTIANCLQRNRRGRMIYTTGTGRSVYAGWAPGWGAPCPVDPGDAYPPCWDGVVTGKSGWAVTSVLLPDGTVEAGRSAAASNLYEVAGPEVQILEQAVRHKYPDGTPERRDCAPAYRTVPTDYIDYVVRQVTPTARFERAGVSFNEIIVTAKRDFVFGSRGGYSLSGFAISDFASRPEGIGDHITLRLADGRILNRVGPLGSKPWHRSGDMDTGCYVAAYPNPLGAGAIYPLAPMRTKTVLTEKLCATTFGLALEGVKARKGDVWRIPFVAVAAPTTLEQGNQVFEDIRRTLGIGCSPGYAIEPRIGTVSDTTGRLLAQAGDSAFAVTLSKTTMPTDLFVQVQGLNERWTCAKQLGGEELVPVTVSRGTAYTALDLNPADVELVVGHPVTCSESAIRVVTWWSDEGLEVYAHNSGEGPVECDLRTNRAFVGLPVAEHHLRLPPGASDVWEISALRGR